MQALPFPTPPKPPGPNRDAYGFIIPDTSHLHPLFKLLNPGATFQSQMFHPKYHYPAPYSAPCIVEFRPDDPIKDAKRVFIGWLPPNSTAHEDPSDLESYSATPTMDREPFRACLQLRLGLDHDYDNAADEHPDPDAYGPLLWLRMPLRTEAPEAPLPGGSSHAAPSTDTSAFVYLAYPALTWYPPAILRDAAADDDDDDDDDDDAEPPGITLTRYTPTTRIPPYVRAAMHDARLARADMCAIDIATVRGGLPLVPGKWMRLRSAVDNALLYDLRALARARAFRVHLPWTPMLAWRVQEMAWRVEREVEASDGRCAKVDTKRLFVGEERVGAAEAWGNFLEWRRKRGAGAAEKRKVVWLCEHKISSTVDRLGLVVRDEEELMEREVEELRAKKRKQEETSGGKGLGHRRSVSENVSSSRLKARDGGGDEEKGANSDEICYNKRPKRKSVG
ncbi:hypothetical protein GTA08_BOTSDO06468 [Botryosphaeria dothidea]|uniref:Uncharacterized protein n=1 Tax=Botryosphaeria dothidea TaxID=55169 RepID=A0A8H4IPG0_9PEZI|nr:hypothetical protein GTA08_BOTSDO06468 [Botryosphaeria dothidea]